MLKKFKVISDVIIGLGFGASMIFLGCMMVIGTPFSFQGSHRAVRADIVDTIQAWLIEQLGAPVAGGLLIVLGVVIGLFIMIPLPKQNDDEE